MSNNNQAINDLGLTGAGHPCACCAGAEASAQPIALGQTELAHPDLVHTERYLVTGMTCSHCVASVTEEVSALQGVDSVDVELAVGGSSVVTVISSQPVSADAIRDAVTEAGYALAN